MLSLTRKPLRPGRVLRVILALAILAGCLAPSLEAQVVCGDATGRTTELVPDMMYRILTAGRSVNDFSSGAYFFALKGLIRNGKLNLVLHGTGQGAGQSDPANTGQSDTLAYTGGVPARGVGEDIDDLLAVVTDPDCFDWGGEIRVFLFVQHGHLDHANQEFVDELNSRSGVQVARAFYHRNDRDILLCQDDTGNLLVHPVSGEVADPAEPWCGFTDRPLQFRGHPADKLIVEADWTEVGGTGDTSCAQISGPFATFNLFDGTVGTVELDTAHVDGGLNLRLGFASGEVVSLSSVSNNSCDYPGATTYGPHP